MTAKRVRAVATILLLWAATTYLFWVGFVGADDFAYARYAYLFHRPPITWWEFRLPIVLAVRSMFLLFGPYEFTAAIPNLAASLMMLAAFGWMVDWPRRLTVTNQLGMMLAAIIPWDVGLRTTTSAAHLGAALAVTGAALIAGPLYECPESRSRILLRYVGALLLGLAFTAHEPAVFFIAIFTVLALYWDFSKYFKPVVACWAVLVLCTGAEAVAYQRLLGDPLARFHSAASAMPIFQVGVDSDVGISGLRYYTWPLELLAFGKVFAGAALVLVIAAIAAWKKLDSTHRLFLTAIFFTWLWIGWGSSVPFAYKPFFRQIHYYGPLLLGIGALLPSVLTKALERYPKLPPYILRGLLLSFFFASAVGGRWGQRVDVTRELMQYAAAQPSQVFVTDVATMNAVYISNQYSMPANIICLNGPTAEHDLLVNKEPAGTPLYHCADKQPDAILVNLEGLSLRTAKDPEFQAYLQQHGGDSLHTFPPDYKWIFAPLRLLLGNRPFMILNLGGEVLDVRR